MVNQVYSDYVSFFFSRVSGQTGHSRVIANKKSFIHHKIFIGFKGVGRDQ
jgi:hypothetical protein